MPGFKLIVSQADSTHLETVATLSSYAHPNLHHPKQF